MCIKYTICTSPNNGNTFEINLHAYIIYTILDLGTQSSNLRYEYLQLKIAAAV